MTKSYLGEMRENGRLLELLLTDLTASSMQMSAQLARTEALLADTDATMDRVLRLTERLVAARIGDAQA